MDPVVERIKMEVYEALSQLRNKAVKDPVLRRKLLETRNSRTPLSDFCRLSTQAGVELYEMDILSAGEDYYAAMRRSTNGGGENSPLLVGEDDYYELFLEELAVMEKNGRNLAGEELMIRGHRSRTRIVMPPIATYQSTEDGKVTEPMLSYYGARAKNKNVGIVVTEHSFIAAGGKAKARQLAISSDEDIDGLRSLVDVIHEGGALAIAQLNHAGSAAPSEVTGGKAVSASSVVLPTHPMMGDGTAPLEMDQAMIDEVVRLFAAAAVRAQAAGYDGAEIHSAHAYLLNQFYSPLTNHRTDEYGGSLEKRLRIHREVLEAVRCAVGEDFILSVRLGGCDYMDGGSTIDDSVYAAKVLEESGADMISLSGGMCRYTRAGHGEAGYFQDMSKAVRAAVSIPVLLTGGVKSLSDAEDLLANGAADLIGVGRELMKDPCWGENGYD